MCSKVYGVSDNSPIPTPVFPHEHLGELETRIAPYAAEVEHGFRLRGVASEMFGPIPDSNNTPAIIDTKLHELQVIRFALLNGTGVGADLGFKDRFPGIIQELGFRAPQSLPIPIGDHDPNDLFEGIEALDPNDKRRMIKIVFSSSGHGLEMTNYLWEAAGVAAQAAATMRLVVQSYEPGEDWRYILHRDPAAIENGEGPNVRIAYKKVRPHVVGDGQATVGDLLEASLIPEESRNIIMDRPDIDLSQVLPANHRLDLVRWGHISQGAFAQLPTAAELAILDPPMLDLFAKLEARYGRRGVLCIDLGRLATDELTLYEEQVVFQIGGGGYLGALIAAGLATTEDTQRIQNYLDRTMSASGRLLLDAR